MKFILIVVVYMHVYLGNSVSISVTKDLTKTECNDVANILTKLAHEELGHVIAYCVEQKNEPTKTK